jgi:hypothetical protein
MLAHVYKQVGTKFDLEAQYKSIGGFLILRALNPALIGPRAFGIATEDPKPSAQKELTNVSRILQNLANETSPSAKNKFLAPFDDFVEQEIPKMRELYDEIVTRDIQAIDNPSVLEVPQDVEQDSLATIWNFIYLHKKDIESGDEDGEFKELFQKIDKEK